MRFKSNAQRKAVMAKLREVGMSQKHLTQIQRNPSIMNKSFWELKKRKVYLRYQGDADKDGVPNVKDCKPLDPKRQGIIHDIISGVGKGAGYIAGETVSGFRDIPKSARTQYRRTKEAEKLKAEQKAVEAEKEIAREEEKRRELVGEEVALRQRTKDLAKTPIPVKKVSGKLKRKRKKQASYFNY